jgi:UDP-glucose:(heptosyl)LPS alpha-1,3-glucosyltransferase
MNLGLCYENVLPARGGCETYIASLARRLVADGHEVHLYACRWDAAVLPANLHCHRLRSPRGPRFLRPWLFSAACGRALEGAGHHLTLGFDRIEGLDVAYPQGGLHAASWDYGLRKHRSALSAWLAGWLRCSDLSHLSYSRLERRQYLGPRRSLVIAISHMVRRHFQDYLGLDPAEVRVVHPAIDPARFLEDDRPRRRLEWRKRWRIRPEETVAVFMAMNYRLKGLEPLLRALRRLPRDRPFRLLVAGSPRTRRWERLACSLDVADRVRFVGHCADSRNCYFAADFLVHPTFYDPCSLVVLEALACGLPVITSRYNGACELLGPLREGYVLDDPHDDERLAMYMARLLDPTRRAACAQAARRTAAQWTFDEHYRLLLQVLTEAAARKRAA